jgi:hypothetical protein
VQLEKTPMNRGYLEHLNMNLNCSSWLFKFKFWLSTFPIMLRCNNWPALYGATAPFAALQFWLELVSAKTLDVEPMIRRSLPCGGSCKPRRASGVHAADTLHPRKVAASVGESRAKPSSGLSDKAIAPMDEVKFTPFGRECFDVLVHRNGKLVPNGISSVDGNT